MTTEEKLVVLIYPEWIVKLAFLVALLKYLYSFNLSRVDCKDGL